MHIKSLKNDFEMIFGNFQFLELILKPFFKKNATFRTKIPKVLLSRDLFQFTGR